ncbi:hypothetical protein AAG906_005680 [Vitis piasezkii]
MRPLWERNMGMCRGLPVVLILDCWGGEQLRAFENVAQEDHALKNFLLILLRLWAVGISFMEKFARNGYAHISSFVNKGCNNLRFCVVQQERRAQSVPQQAQRLRLSRIFAMACGFFLVSHEEIDCPVVGFSLILLLFLP